jgi:hypothetical protein
MTPPEEFEVAAGSPVLTMGGATLASVIGTVK